MQIAKTPFERFILQVRRRAIALSLLAAVLGTALAAFLDPVETRGGAIALAVSGSVLASLIVAAMALERAEAADEFARLGISGVFQDRLHDLPEDLWTDLLENARHHFRVLGTANHGYLNDESAKIATEKALRTALARKDVQVEFLWLDPTTDIAVTREREEAERKLRRDACDAIAWFSELVAKLPDDARSRVSLRAYTSPPTCGITWADKNLIVTHYLAGRLNLRAPGVVLDTSDPALTRRVVPSILRRPSKTPGLAAAYVKNYSEIASDAWSSEITEERLGELRAYRDSLGEQVGLRSEAELRAETEEQ